MVTEQPLVRDTVMSQLRARRLDVSSALDLHASHDLRSAVRSISGVSESIEIEISYEGYIRRHREQVERLRASEAVTLPSDYDFSSLSALSREARDILSRVRPATLGQASRLPGVTPADAAILLSTIQRT